MIPSTLRYRLSAPSKNFLSSIRCQRLAPWSPLPPSPFPQGTRDANCYRSPHAMVSDPRARCAGLGWTGWGGAPWPHNFYFPPPRNLYARGARCRAAAWPLRKGRRWPGWPPSAKDRKLGPRYAGTHKPPGKRKLKGRGGTARVSQKLKPHNKKWRRYPR